MADIDEGFETGTEITFNCIKGAAGERTTWKIICEDGIWAGRSFDCGKNLNYVLGIKLIHLYLQRNNVHYLKFVTSLN